MFQFPELVWLFELVSKPETQPMRLVLVLGHFLWQGEIVAATMAGGVRLMQIQSPRLRYVMSVSAFLLLIACPIATWIAIPVDTQFALENLRQADVPVTADSTPMPDANPNATGITDEKSHNEQLTSDVAAAAFVLDQSPSNIEMDGQWIAPWILAVWLLGAVGFSLRLFVGATVTWQWRASVEQLPDSLATLVTQLCQSLGMRVPRVALSARVLEAVAVGLFRPMILLPVSWAATIPPDMLEAILAHELAHIRRCDLWVNLLQGIVESIFFYHPVVWWLSRRLRQERELCCDDVAVSLTNDRVRYAEMLEHIGHLRLAPTRNTLAVTMRGSRFGPLERVRHVLGGNPAEHSRGSSIIASILLLAAIIAGSVAVSKTMVADEMPSRPPLERKVSLNFPGTPLVEVLTMICNSVGMKLELNEAALKNAGYTKNMAVTSTAEKPVTLKDALTLVLKPFEKLSFTVDQNRIVVSTREVGQKLEQPKRGEKLDADSEAKLKWGEAVNGLRGAIAIRHSTDKPKAEDKPDIYLALQNVSQAPIHLTDMNVPTHVNLRVLYPRKEGRIMAGLGTREPAMGDVMLQSGEIMFIPFFDPDTKLTVSDDPTLDGRTLGASFAEDVLNDARQSLTAKFQIDQAPAGAWTGQITTGETTGADAVDLPQPNGKEAKSLFKKWQNGTRANGNIPGGALGPLVRVMTNFVKNNPTHEGATKFVELLKRIDVTRDWSRDEAVKLLDEVTAIYPSLPEWVEGETRFVLGGDVVTGKPLPDELKDAPWGEAQPNGLRMAWLLQPRAAEHRLNTPLKSRLLFHNSGKQAVVFRALTWNQSGGHKARDAQGAEININSTNWTTIPTVFACRLAPGEFIEVIGAGIGVGANKDQEDWRETRVGSWIEAKAGDEVTFQPDAINCDGRDAPLPETDGAQPAQMNWWLSFISNRLNLDAPLPADAAERGRLLDRATRELFGNAPTDEEHAAFRNDATPEALDALANRLAERSGFESFSGSLTSSSTRFKVLPVDPDAAKKPRTARNPGQYKLGGNATFVVTRRGIGERTVNEARLTFAPADATAPAPREPHEIKLPDGYDTWAAAWVRSGTVLWVQQKGTVSSYDFSNAVHVKETAFDETDFNKVPKAIKEALTTALDVPGAPKQVSEADERQKMPLAISGKILSIAPDRKVVEISVGEADGIKLRMKLQVREKGSKDNRDQPPVVKGTIEVIRIIDRNTSEARILEVQGNSDLAKDDDVIPTELAAMKKVRATAPLTGLEFLKPYPKLQVLSLDMTEMQFLEIVQQQDLQPQRSVDGDKSRYEIGTGDGHIVIVMFGNNGEKCSGIQRIRGDVAPPAPPDQGVQAIEKRIELQLPGAPKNEPLVGVQVEITEGHGSEQKKFGPFNTTKWIPRRHMTDGIELFHNGHSGLQ